MKKKLIRASTVIAFFFTVYSCGKDDTKICRTCTARYAGQTIKSIDACSTQDENDFKTQYYYAEVSCQ